jgi:hypothetical protein
MWSAEEWGRELEWNEGLAKVSEGIYRLDIVQRASRIFWYGSTHSLSCQDGIWIRLRNSLSRNT